MLVLGAHAVAATTVFDRLGGDLWLLIPAFLFAMLGSALIGRVLGVRRSFSANVLSGLFGFALGVAVSLLIANDKSDAIGRTSAATCSSSRCSARWPRACGSSSSRVPGALARAQTGLQSVPHPIRSLQRRSRRVRRYAEITRIAARNGLGPSLGLGPKDDLDGKRPPPVRRLRLALEECGGMFVKLGQILSTRTDLLPRRRHPRAVAAPGQRAARRPATRSRRCWRTSSTARSTRRSSRSTGSRSRRRRSARCTARSCPTARR